MDNSLVQWVRCTKPYYDNLENKETNTLYFLEDTNEIYKGAINYNRAIEFVETLPEIFAENRLYVLEKDNSVYTQVNGKLEKVILSPQEIEISQTLSDDVINTGLVSGEAIKQYVTVKTDDIKENSRGIKLFETKELAVLYTNGLDSRPGEIISVKEDNEWKIYTINDDKSIKELIVNGSSGNSFWEYL